MQALIERVKVLILKPRETWETVVNESTEVIDLFKEYLLIAAAVPAVASLIGRWIVGIRIPFVGVYRLTFFEALSSAIVEYLLIVGSVWAAGKVIHYLADKFDSNEDENRAYKLIVFSYLPYLAAGVLYLIPSLGTLVVLVGLYCLYIFYVGLPIVMETPKDKVLAFEVVTILALLVIYLIVSLISGTLMHIFGPSLPQL